MVDSAQNESTVLGNFSDDVKTLNFQLRVDARARFKMPARLNLRYSYQET